MSKKIAMITHLPEHQECSACHCFTQNGYILRDSRMARFVCEECYASTFQGDYPIAEKIIELNKKELESFLPEGKKPGFHAGYLLGTRDNTSNGYKITVSKLVDSIHSSKGTTCFFNKEDALLLRKLKRNMGVAIVGLYRTSPSGAPDFNILDNKTIEDMLLDVVYVIIGGSNEIQIAVKDKHSQIEDIGVIVS